MARFSFHIGRLQFTAFALIVVGCDPPNTSSDVHSGLEFEKADFDLGSVKENQAEVRFRFRMISAESDRIRSINKTCGCVETDTSMVGLELQRGKTYEFPVSVRVAEKEAFREQVVVCTESGQRTYLTICGVHEGRPRLVPAAIHCETNPEVELDTELATDLVGGKFMVLQVRHESSAPLVPSQPVGQSAFIEIRHLRTNFATQISKLDKVVRDELHFEWRLRKMPEDEFTEIVMIPWASGIPASEMRFQFSRQAIVSGLPDRVYFQQSNQQARATKAFPLRKLEDASIELVEVSNPIVNVELQQNGAFTVMKVHAALASLNMKHLEEFFLLRLSRDGDELIHRVDVILNGRN